MKFSCTQENLNHGLAIVNHVAGKNNNLPILQNVLIKANDGQIDLFATNLEIGIQATIRGKVDEPGDFTIPAQLLSNYINLLTTEKIDCELINNELNFFSNQQHSIIKGEVASDFPILPKVEKNQFYTILKDDLENGLRQVIIAAAIDDTRPEIAGVYMNFSSTNLTMAATDSYRLAEKTIPLQTSSQASTIILPQRSAQELLRVLENISSPKVEIYVTEHQFACLAGGIQFISRAVEGNFPDYKQIILKQGDVTAEVMVKELIRAIKGAALFSKNGVNDIELSFDASTSTIKIKSVNQQLGENVTTITAKISGNNNSVVLNHRYVLDGLQQLQDNLATIYVLNNMSPVTFYPMNQSGYLYIVMPIKQ